MRGISTDFYLIALFSGFVLCVGMSLTSSLFRVFGRSVMVSRGLRSFLQGLIGRRALEGAWMERLGMHLPIFVGLWATFFGAAGLLGMRLFSLSWLESLLISLPISLVSTGFLGWWVWIWFFANEEAGVLRGSVLFGTIAQVSLTIPAQGVGRITFVAEGAIASMPARAREGVTLLLQSRVMIVDLDGPIAIVEAY